MAEYSADANNAVAELLVQVNMLLTAKCLFRWACLFWCLAEATIFLGS